MPYAQAAQNLRLYLNKAVLPTMVLSRTCPIGLQDTKAEDDLYLLSPEPDSRRKLTTIIHLQSDLMNRKINSFLLKQIPDAPIEGIRDSPFNRRAKFHLPARAFLIDYIQPPSITDMQTMRPWMYMPLLTAARAVCIVWPEQTKGLSITMQKHVHPYQDADLYQAFFWSKIGNLDPDNVQESTTKLVVVALAPWVLLPDDLNDFVKLGRFPAFSIDQGRVHGPAGYTRAHKVWAKIWDDCTRKNCPYFVLSLYHTWVFGVFVKGWTMVFLSDPIRHTDRRSKSTVMQWLVFWMAAAAGLPGAWSAPKLKSFYNPDISNESTIATRLSHSQMPEEEFIAHTDWLEQNHKQAGNSGKTVQSVLSDKLWVTKYD